MARCWSVVCLNVVAAAVRGWPAGMLQGWRCCDRDDASGFRCWLAGGEAAAWECREVGEMGHGKSTTPSPGTRKLFSHRHSSITIPGDKTEWLGALHSPPPTRPTFISRLRPPTRATTTTTTATSFDSAANHRHKNQKLRKTPVTRKSRVIIITQIHIHVSHWARTLARTTT